jgi:hypothetical protein
MAPFAASARRTPGGLFWTRLSGGDLVNGDRNAVSLGAIAADPTRQFCLAAYRECVAFCESQQPLAVLAECDNTDENRLITVGSADRRGCEWPLCALAVLWLSGQCAAR